MRENEPNSVADSSVINSLEVWKLVHWKEGLKKYD